MRIGSFHQLWPHLFGDIFSPHFYFHGFQGKKHYCLHILGPPLQHLDFSLRTFKMLLCRETFSKRDVISCRKKKEEKKKPAHFERCCLQSPSLPFPRAVPSWHHSSAVRRSGTVGRSLAARRQSACRAPPAATWPAFPTAGSLSWQPGKNKQGSLSSSLSIYNTAELNKSPHSERKSQTLRRVLHLHRYFHNYCLKTFKDSASNFQRLGQATQFLNTHPHALREGIHFYYSNF